MPRLTSFRLYLCLLVQLVVAVPVFAQGRDSTYAVIEELDVKVELRDGVRLSANVYRPGVEGKFPALLMRSPYGNGGPGNGTGHFFASRGYVVVLQDVRGRYESEGLFDALRNEGPDGYETQMWVASQPWCDGKIGTIGGSYVGFTQWIAAPRGCPNVLAMFPVVGFGDQYDMAYSGGTFRMRLFSQWSFEMDVPFMIDEKHLGDIQSQVFRSLPLIDQDKVHGYRVSYLRDWLSHPARDKYWQNSSIYGQYGKITAAACNVGGWFDICLKGTLDNFTGMTSEAVPAEIRAKQKLIVGPWIHSISRDGKTGELDFGKESVLDFQQLQLGWFDHWLRGENTDIASQAPVRIFVMGTNQWRDENEWPLARTRYVKYYLDGGGKANTLDGDGKLSLKPAARSVPDTYIYDPMDPVPSSPMEPTCQRGIEKRQDVLVYSTPPLDKALEVTGPLKVVLHAASSAPNTDFTAKLVDVFPDGRALKIAEGIIRASFRNGQTDPRNIEPGKINHYEIDLWSTSNVFLAGHSIRVEISSSNFPRFERNLNTGLPAATDTTWQRATQTIYHDKDHASFIVLPVID